MRRETRKSKAGLLLGLGLGAAVMVAGFSSCDGLFKNNKNNKNNEEEAYNACASIADYRAYMSKYGPQGIHYNDAKNVIDRYVADSLEKAVARNKALRKAEAEEEEDELFMNCTTIATCDKYLKEYPRGRYVSEVMEIKAELEKEAAAKAEKEEEEAYKKCTTIEGCKKYLKAYPNGKYVTAVNKKKAELEKKESEEKKNVKVVPKKDNNNNSGTTTVKPQNNQKKTTTKDETKAKAVKVKK